MRLSGLVEFEKGKKAEQVYVRPADGLARYLQIDDLRPDATPKYVRPFPCPLAAKTDVVIAWDGANAGTVSFGLEGYVGSTLAIVRPTTDDVLTPYLGRFLESRFDGLQASTNGATVPHLSRDALERLEIPLPSPLVQHRIAALLDEADRLRRMRRNALELSDQFLPALFLRMFGDPAANTKDWETATLDELLATDPQNGIYKPESQYGSGTPILRIDAFYDGVVTGMPALKRVRLTPEEVAAYQLREGNIVVNRVNSPEFLGKSALIPFLREPTVFESNMMRLSVDEKKVNRVYLIHYLQTGFVKRQILTTAKDAVNQSSINQQDVSAWAIRRPPRSLQDQFAFIVSEHSRQAVAYREALRQAEHLFQSLLEQYFGELRRVA